MKTINQIANETVDKIEPGLARSIESYADATHPELVRGRESLMRRRESLVSTIEAALKEAFEAGKMEVFDRH